MANSYYSSYSFLKVVHPLKKNPNQKHLGNGKLAYRAEIFISKRSQVSFFLWFNIDFLDCSSLCNLLSVVCLVSGSFYISSLDCHLLAQETMSREPNSMTN